MFSRISIVVAVGFISVASGLVRERRSAYDSAVMCTKAGTNAAAVASVQANSDVAMVEDACIYLREFAQCIAMVDPAEYSSPVANIVHFLVAYEWQHNYLAEKAGLCKNMLVGEMKNIALQSGIMEEEQLQNVEEDPYAQCAGDAMRKCMIRAVQLKKLGISQDFLSSITDYIGCYEEKGANCEAPIFKHFIAVMKAYRKHLEEKHGEYGKMVHKIPLPQP